MKKMPLDPSEWPFEEGYTNIPNELLDDLIADANTATAIGLYVNKLAFAAGEQWITITVPELSKALERPVSKVRRGLKRAVERGWVVREDLENGFRLSMRDSIPNDSPKT